MKAFPNSPLRQAIEVIAICVLFLLFARQLNAEEAGARTPATIDTTQPASAMQRTDYTVKGTLASKLTGFRYTQDLAEEMQRFLNTADSLFDHSLAPGNSGHIDFSFKILADGTLRDVEIKHCDLNDSTMQQLLAVKLRQLRYPPIAFKRDVTRVQYRIDYTEPSMLVKDKEDPRRAVKIVALGILATVRTVTIGLAIYILYSFGRMAG